MFVASRPSSFRGQRVGNGHCAPFVQRVSGAPLVRHWRRGRRVRDARPVIPKYTAIATFGSDGRYTNRTDGSAHAAIFISQLADGLRVWDQWINQPVHQRTIRFRGGQGRASNDGDRFYVIVT
jgi:hypothetical protein